MRIDHLSIAAVVSASLAQVGLADPLDASRVLGSKTCMTSGCHGGAGLDKGAHGIWKNYDPHFNAAATLGNGRSRAMAQELKLESAAGSKSCTVCHSPLSDVDPAKLAPTADAHGVDSGVSCASCHGPEENWILSHTRPDYPKDALTKLGMRQLDTAYQRANNCVACHQNLSDELVGANHPPLVFELDGLLVAEPKHWREGKDFSHTKTWLVGQAVALREAAAQASREPGGRREAEIQAISALLKATATGWDDSRRDVVRASDDFAKEISGSTMAADQSRVILRRLLSNRAPYEEGAFGGVDAEFRTWAVGYYSERLALAIDRLNQALGGKAVKKVFLDELFDAAKPPKGFDTDASEAFERKLEQLATSNPEAE